MFIMSKYQILTSTTRRRLLTDFIDSKDSKMMKFCSTCRRYSRVYKVHLRSESCNECLRRNQRCDVRVIENEWKKFKTEKFKLRQEIRDALAAQKETRKAEDKAAFERRVTLVKEMRLRQQMNLLEKRVDEAIALKEAQIVEENPIMNFDLEDPMPSLHLGPLIWSALDDLSDSFWQLPHFDETFVVVSDNLSGS